MSKTRKKLPYRKLIQGDCREALRQLPESCIDSVITDPPYGISFMGRDWDHGVPGVPFWEEILRVAKPGAMLLAFGGTRTYHRLACALEDAGWEIRDCLMWLYGTGFPKSHDISAAIDKSAQVERPIIGFSKQQQQQRTPKFSDRSYGQYHGQTGWITGPSTELAKQWDGWGTALKPAWEPIILAMKPLDGTFAQNAEKHGVAGLDIDGARIPTDENLNGGAYAKEGIRSPSSYLLGSTGREYQQPVGRWPANVVHDGSEEATEGFPTASGKSASRFFYCAKAGKRERGEGNNHPTVKPLALLEYLCKLTMTPSKGVVLDPFMGSGTTGLACKRLGRRFVGIELGPDSFEIAKRRINGVTDA